MIGDSISIFASIGRLHIELWLLLCCLKQPPIIDSSTKFENRPFPDKKLAQVPYTGEGHRKPKKKDYGHRKPIAVTESQFEKARSQKANFGFTNKPI